MEEGYLYGRTIEGDRRTGFAINPQGESTAVTLPTELLADLLDASTAILNISTEFEVATLEAKSLPPRGNMVKIYDNALLQTQLNAMHMPLQI